eukprot:CAMPEP_0197179002 /NCGR_PEP_ID=MMETSP1423-20130617/4093_1 /TAXON_ID=476441 /ORGANISM="Pseudo-nitzschia heimii, Strain UNC1101" /LENGTH=842 /DNA_ID=CAMNT_0042628839 /DNA_START=373 /DNA_END=2901 /DNA_ORIENTATION=-
MATANLDPFRGASSPYDNQQGQPEMEHRPHISASRNQNHFRKVAFARGPLSPQSAPPTTAVVAGDATASTVTTPVPSVIHTESSTDGERMYRRAGSGGSAPYFPVINRSSSGNMSGSATSGSSNIVAKRGVTKVTGKKKHQNNKTKPGSSHSVSSPRPHDGGGGGTATTNGQKKQRRLERNRLSAQLSRRRRKHYLEELEVRVVRLSLEMDRGRREHAFQALERISEMRKQVLESAEAIVCNIESSTASMNTNNDAAMLHYQLDSYLRLLENRGPLSRMGSEELVILNSFLGQQLKSFSLPSHAKFILWLSLQGDPYYRGGRAASERLSAARIGERMLVNGIDKVASTDAMWPLVCNEVGLSYELEERLRVYQRTTILQEKTTWLHRHTARSSSLVMQSFHDAVGGMSEMVGNRENAMMKDVLNPSQRVKFLAWAQKHENRIAELLERRRQQQREELKAKSSKFDPNDIYIGTYVDPDYRLNKSHHLAANLYILNHQLSRILQDFPYQSLSILTPPILKKLMRRASFESLGQQKDTDARAIAREDSSHSSTSIKSHPSHGSLLKSTSNLSLGASSNDTERPNQITPQVGEQAAVELVNQALGFVKLIIPPTPKPMNPTLSSALQSAAVSNNTMTSILTQDTAVPMAMDYHSHHLVPTTVNSYGAPMLLAPAHPAEQHITPVPHYEGMPIHHPNHPPTQLESHNYTISNGLVHPPSEVQHSNPPYIQAENYYPPQQHINYTHTSTVPSHSHQLTPINQEPISPIYQPSSAAIPHEQSQPPATKGQHERKSSFLPASLNHLNVVPEDMFPGVEGTAADFIELQDCLMDGEDWGVGIGLDMDTSA